MTAAEPPGPGPTGGEPSNSRENTSPYDEDEASPFQPEQAKPLVKRVFPVTQTLTDYPQRSLRRDAIAGVTVEFVL